MKLYPYQDFGRAWLWPKQYAILADDMGLGKSAQAITASRDFDRILVVCPAIARENWAREFKMWRPDSHPVTPLQDHHIWNNASVRCMRAS